MTIDRRLLDILCCPVSRQPLVALPSAALARLNAQIEGGALQAADGSVVMVRLDEALCTPDQRRVYPVLDGIPALLPESAILWDPSEMAVKA